ncbi:MAG: tetratricopeptide repeat protein [Bacteroidales bacterium]|nr:tetratricopeptide repeat protein [Bacteroidales bacterium]
MKKLFLVLLEISLSSLWIINFFSGIVGAIWLVITGGWSLVVIGLIYSFLMPWVYTIASLPTWLIVPLVVKAAEKGNRVMTAILGFILSGYNNFILSVWVSFVFIWAVTNTQYPLIAILLWGYSIAMGPVGYMASKEGPDAGTGTTLGVLFTQVAYLVLVINLLFGNSALDGGIWLWVLIFIFTLFTSWMGYLSVSSKTQEKLGEIIPEQPENDSKDVEEPTPLSDESLVPEKSSSDSLTDDLTNILDKQLIEGDFKEAIISCNKILKRDPKNIHATFNLGFCYQRMKQHKKAIGYFNKTLKLDENHLIAMSNKAISLGELGELKDANLLYKSLLKRAISNGNKSVAMFASYNLNNFGQSLDLADDLLSENQDDLDALFYKSLALKDLQRYEESMATAYHLLTLQPENIFAMGLIGDIYYQIEKYQESIDIFNKLLEINPNDPNAMRGIKKAELELLKTN